MKNLLIENGIIITLGEPCKVLTDHVVLTEDGMIKKIAKKSEINGVFDRVINAKGKVIMPGFINAHMHFYSTLVRGLGKAKSSKDFQEVLENLWWRLDKKLTLEDTYYSTIIMLLNAIRHGTTTLIDHHASPFAVRGSLAEIARAVKETGLRSCLCYELSDRDGEKIANEGIAENIEFIKHCQKNPDDQIKALFGLHASFTITEKTLAKAAAAGNELNTGFHVHVAEAISDQEKTIQMCGKRVVERFHEFEILGPKTIAAHGIHLTDHEIDLLAETNTMLAHNPQSNMNNAVGIADIIKMQQKGVLVGLGTDAMTVNMLEEVRVALWAQHLRANNPSVGFMEAANALFTNNCKIAARVWDDAKLGVLAEGYAADIILIDYYAPTPLNENTVLGHLIFGISQSQVDTTIVKGRVLMENKLLQLNIDEEKLAHASQKVTEKLWERF
ncbi:MAG: putative aminohydrolase SsnA [Gammaproteobacteria bacterium]|nr:putative aminohydrolase SsnA [Gammaproteobacteria bacterium]